MSKTPLSNDTSLTTYSILCNGKEIPNSYQVSELRIEQKVNRIAEAEIEFYDGDPADQKFEITDSDVFAPGVEVEIKLGYESKNDLVFKGVVAKQTLKVNDQGSFLVVSCRDKAQKMTLIKKSAIYTKVKDSEVMSQVISDNDLVTSVIATSEQKEEVVQYNCSDWDFVVARAEANGMMVITNNGKVEVAKPEVSADPSLALTFGYDIIDFDSEMDATYQYSDIKSSAWDMSTQAIVEGSSNEPSVNGQGNISGSKLSDVFSAGSAQLFAGAPLTSDGLKGWSNAALLKARLSRFTGTMKFQGSSEAKVNTLIGVKGLSERFNGNAYISGVTHLVEDGRWLTEVEMGLSHNWFSDTHNISALGASGITPDIKGLHTGVVKKIDSDPSNQFRVQVTVPLLNADADAVWARLSSIYASNSFGVQFMPEIGDEVILGFMNQDPSYPIILGSLYSSKNQAPLIPDENNTYKTIVTKSELKVTFDDDKKVVTIETPAGNKLVMSDEDKGITLTDQNGNSCSLNEDGITLDSKSNISISAEEDVTIKGSSISISGNSSVDVKGAQVSIKADSQATINGSAQCEVSSDGQMTVKGAMVSIN